MICANIWQSCTPQKFYFDSSEQKTTQFLDMHCRVLSEVGQLVVCTKERAGKPNSFAKCKLIREE